MSSMTTSEEWTKVADAIERRKIQNRNAQRKYRNNLKKRVEELERNGTFIALANGTKTHSPSSSREPSQLMSEQNMHTLNSILNGSEPQDQTWPHPQKFSSRLEYTTPSSELEVGSSKAEPLRSSPLGTINAQGNYIDVQETRSLEFDEHNLSAVPIPSSWSSGRDMSFFGSVSDESMAFNAHIFASESMMTNDGDTTETTSPTSETNEGRQFSAECQHGSIGSLPTDNPALRLNSFNTVQNLRKAPTDESDIRGRTPLHLAAARGHLQIVQLLVGKGTDVDAKDDQGWTALHLAVERGHQAVVQVLLDAGANLHGKG